MDEAQMRQLLRETTLALAGTFDLMKADDLLVAAVAACLRSTFEELLEAFYGEDDKPEKKVGGLHPAMRDLLKFLEP